MKLLETGWKKVPD